MTRQPLLTMMALLATAIAVTAADQLLTATADASFHVRNRKYGDLLRPRDASNRDGAPIMLYPRQPWKCMIWQFSDAGENRFRLKNRFTSKSLGPAAGADAVEQIPCAADAHDAPAWVFHRLDDGAYRVDDPGSDRVLTAMASPQGDIRVVLGPWRDADEQKWELIEAPANPTM